MLDNKFKENKKILLIGPRYFNNSNKTGGIVVLFEDLLKYCDDNDIQYTVVDTNKANYVNRIVSYFSILLKIFKYIKKSTHISLHGTSKDYLLIAPFAVFCSKYYSKKISLRKFAGSFYDIYEKSNFFLKKIYKYSLKNSDFIYFETKFLVMKFLKFNDHVIWWPNSRCQNFDYRTSNVFSKRFVFISQIKYTKGIYEFMEASRHYDSSYVFDMYGPIMDDDFERRLENYKNINYRGVLKANKVPQTLSDYDVLVLPTYHEGEGYPGIVIEAFCIGLPVISTKWNSIPEIVENQHNGIIIPIKDVSELVNAISYYTTDNYSDFSRKAFESFAKFNSNNVYFRFFNTIKSEGYELK